MNTHTEVNLWGNYVAVLLQIYFSICGKNYQNTMRFEKFIAKIEGCNFLPNSVVTMEYRPYSRLKFQTKSPSSDVAKSHEASRGFSAIAELLVSLVFSNRYVENAPLLWWLFRPSVTHFRVRTFCKICYSTWQATELARLCKNSANS